jgi:hypothetical protein
LRSLLHGIGTAMLGVVPARKIIGAFESAFQ